MRKFSIFTVILVGCVGSEAPSEGADTANVVEACGAVRVVAPGPGQEDLVALARFAPPLVDGRAVVERFAFERDYARPGCAALPTEVVAFSGSTETPPEIPTDAHGTPALDTGSHVEVVLDPPLVLTEERPFAFVGVRMETARGQSVCVMACEEGNDRSWWSTYPLSPFVWQPVGADPPGYGFMFSISTR